jgi:CheY-like chemotaxis protein
VLHRTPSIEPPDDKTFSYLEALMPVEASPKLRVLYCEDHPDTREMMRFALGAEGFDVICPEDSDDCLRLAKEQHFDACVLDNLMPGLSGTILCQQIKQFRPHMAIVFFSGAARHEDKERALAAGAHAYIIKPAAVEKVVRVLRETIQTVRLVSELKRREPIDVED